jgi:hypothetical protein
MTSPIASVASFLVFLLVYIAFIALSALCIKTGVILILAKGRIPVNILHVKYIDVLQVKPSPFRKVTDPKTTQKAQLLLGSIFVLIGIIGFLSSAVNLFQRLLHG